MQEKDKKKANALNCWEFWDCPPEVRDKCPAFIRKEGRRCWICSKDFTSKDCPGAKYKVKFCCECPWYKVVHEEEGSKVKE